MVLSCLPGASLSKAILCSERHFKGQSVLRAANRGAHPRICREPGRSPLKLYCKFVYCPIDPFLPPWCLPGCPNGSFLPPWCLPGASLAVRWILSCLPGASRAVQMVLSCLPGASLSRATSLPGASALSCLPGVSLVPRRLSILSCLPGASQAVQLVLSCLPGAS